ncbi:MAG: excinuclease ABC [Bacteroidales bacterium]|nr:excinuclease ABC [Bacteroidales bacterium]
MNGFSVKAKEELGYYVYALLDPRDNRIFYIGKGENDRVFQHAAAAITDPKQSDKLDMIREIITAGLKVKYYILRHGLQKYQALDGEEVAYAIESAIINLLSYQDFPDIAKLSNIQPGHHQKLEGIKTVEEIEELYNCPEIGTNEILHEGLKLICININSSYSRNEDIYQAVRGAWSLNKQRADKCTYVIAEYHGIIRGIFKPNDKGWYDSGTRTKNGKIRYCFDGNEVFDTKLTNMLLGKKLTPERPKGSQNPIRYIC